MVVLNHALPKFNLETTLAFYTTDDLLDGSPILIFYGPSATTTSSASASRIQAHIFSPAGLISYPRLAISPGSPLYTAVHQLPRQEQGDDVCRGLAFSLYKYFTELPEQVREVWASLAPQWTSAAHVPDLFSSAHAALLAPKLQRVADVKTLVACAKSVFSDHTLSWLDMDVVFPPGSLRTPNSDPATVTAVASALARASLDSTDEVLAAERYGNYVSLVGLFGDLAFLPTSKLRRAPSKPGLNRNRSFLRHQKESLRREMCELLDTEESYVSKLFELVHSVANEFREKARLKSATSTSPTEAALEGLFPPSLDAILDANSDFLEDLRTTLEETENAAIEDIQATDDTDPTPYSAVRDSAKADLTGAVRVAKCLLRWLPRFRDCYSAYIAAHSNFTGHLRTFMRDSPGSFSRRVVETGEQRLMSLLIEPVQRLPRYSMFIDNIIKQLPLRHPAMTFFLKARDVVSEICAREDTPVALSCLIEELKQHVTNVPAEFPAYGRFITAVDAAMLLPRRNDADPTALLSCPAVLLLFTDCLVVLRRLHANGISASSLRARLDNPTLDPGSGDKQAPSAQPLEHIVSYPLSSLDISEMDSGKKILIIRRPKSEPGSRTISRASSTSGSTLNPDKILTRADILSFSLLGQYDGRASRLLEEIAKARVEWRYSETERESPQWEVRSTSVSDLNLFSALCESGNADFESVRAAPARVRVLVDYEKQTSSPDSVLPSPEDFDAEILVFLSVHEGDKFVLEVCCAGVEEITTDHLRKGEIVPVLVKRLSNLLKLRAQLHTCPTPLILPLLLRNKGLLAALPTMTDEDGGKAQEASSVHRNSVSRPTSPVKMLTNLFSASVSRESSRKSRHHLSRSVILNPSEVPRIAPPPQSKPSSRPTSKDATITSANNTPNVQTPTDGPVTRLETTFTTYIIALHARKGNVVGRAVQNRAQAHELEVNELYNTLLEDPSHHQIAAQCSVDVLLAAFEKFVRFAWVDTIGPIISVEAALRIQTCFEQASHSSEFISGFREIFFKLSPENQRAFRTMIALLSDLLDGTNNDSDKGILTACFAEILIAPTGTNPYYFISIIDRFMEDFDAFFGPQRPLPSAHSSVRQSKVSSQASSGMGSLTSNTSIRKRLGFGLGSLSRDSHKLDSSVYGNSELSHSGGLGSVWRSLSKNKALAQGIDPAAFHSMDRNGSVRTNPSQTTSPLKSVSNGHSFDLPRALPTPSSIRSNGSDSRTRQDQPFDQPSGSAALQPRPMPAFPARPVAHERPTVLGAFGIDRGAPGGRSVMDVSHSTPTNESAGAPQRRTKRRSSLSDIHTLRAEVDGQGTPRWEGDTSLPVSAMLRGPSTPGQRARSPAGLLYGSPLPPMPSPLQPRSPSKRTPGRPSGLPMPKGTSGITSPIITRTGSPIRNAPPPPSDSPIRSQAPRIGDSTPSRKENTAPLPVVPPSPGMPPLTSIPRLSTQLPSKKPVGSVGSHIPRMSFAHGSSASPSPGRNQWSRAEVTIPSGGPLSARTDRNAASGSPSDHPSDRDSQILTPNQQEDSTLLSKASASHVPVLAPPGVSGSGATPPQKLKMQSPSKLRERLQTERQALVEAEASFQSELEKITSEIRALEVEESTGGLVENEEHPSSSSFSKTLRIKHRRVIGGKVVPAQDGSHGPQINSSHPRIQALEKKLLSLDGRIRSMTLPMQQALAALSKDFDSSLQVSEARARNLDKLYHEALADNEALHARFNEELDRIVKSFAAANEAGSAAVHQSDGPEGSKDGDGKFELLVQEEAKRREGLVDEVEKLRRENARLKRELSGVKAQLRS